MTILLINNLANLFFLISSLFSLKSCPKNNFPIQTTRLSWRDISSLALRTTHFAQTNIHRVLAVMRMMLKVQRKTRAVKKLAGHIVSADGSLRYVLFVFVYLWKQNFPHLNATLFFHFSTHQHILFVRLLFSCSVCCCWYGFVIVMISSVLSSSWLVEWTFYF